jgi:hypothetical protein
MFGSAREFNNHQAGIGRQFLRNHFGTVPAVKGNYPNLKVLGFGVRLW